MPTITLTGDQVTEVLELLAEVGIPARRRDLASATPGSAWHEICATNLRLAQEAHAQISRQAFGERGRLAVAS